MKNKTKQLKVKIKSLAAESKIIRLEEKRAQVKKDATLYASLYTHRIINVRNESRWSHLAYGFLRGLKYEQIEGQTKSPIKWDRVEKMVESFGVTYDYNSGVHYSEVQILKLEQKERFEKWKANAEKYIYEKGKRYSRSD